MKNKNKGGKAISIITSFSKENVKWEKNQNESLNILFSKLAVILYKDNTSSELIGVDGGKKEDFELKDIFAVFSFKEGKNNILIFKVIRRLILSIKSFIFISAIKILIFNYRVSE